MKRENLLKLQAYLDNEISPQEARQVGEWLAEDAEAQAILRRLSETKVLFAGNELPVKMPEARDFYWSKIKREIGRREAASERERSPLLAQWWLRLAVPFAGVALLIVLLLTFLRPLTSARSLAGYFHEIETPLEEVSAISFHSQAAGLTVVWIDTSGGEDTEED